MVDRSWSMVHGQRPVALCRRFWTVLAFVVTVLLASSAHAGGHKKDAAPPCIPVAEAARQATAEQPSQDICVSAHVYNVAELGDGTRFLDVCPAEVADQDCHFLIVSLREDRDEVGDLRKYRDSDIQLRGVMRPMHGRMGIVLSHARQFSGGPEKFKPNPRLLHGFNGESDRMPVRDPNLKGSGHVRSFMNTRDKEEVPLLQKH